MKINTTPDENGNPQLDEIFATNATVHIEQLDTGRWWIGITTKQGTWHIDLGTVNPQAKTFAHIHEIPDIEPVQNMLHNVAPATNGKNDKQVGKWDVADALLSPTDDPAVVHRHYVETINKLNEALGELEDETLQQAFLTYCLDVLEVPSVEQFYDAHKNQTTLATPNTPPKPES